MNVLVLDKDTKSILDRIRHSGKYLSIFDMPADLAEAAVWEVCRGILDHSRLPMVQRNQYRWFLRELSKLLRKKTGWDLALELEICLRKWTAYSLDQSLLQRLLCECYYRIAAMTPDVLEQVHEEAAAKIRVRAAAGRVINSSGVGNG